MSALYDFAQLGEITIEVRVASRDRMTASLDLFGSNVRTGNLVRMVGSASWFRQKGDLAQERLVIRKAR